MSRGGIYPPVPLFGRSELCYVYVIGGDKTPVNLDGMYRRSSFCPPSEGGRGLFLKTAGGCLSSQIQKQENTHCLSSQQRGLTKLSARRPLSCVGSWVERGSSDSGRV